MCYPTDSRREKLIRTKTKNLAVQYSSFYNWKNNEKIPHLFIYLQVDFRLPWTWSAPLRKWRRKVGENMLAFKHVTYNNCINSWLLKNMLAFKHFGYRCWISKCNTVKYARSYATCWRPPAELVHHDEPVLVVAPGQWRSQPKFEA
jgi:hypothetical protein